MQNIEEIIYTELDPLNTDGRAFIKNTAKKFDLVIKMGIYRTLVIIACVNVILLSLLILSSKTKAPAYFETSA